MLYYLSLLTDWFSPLNVFRYVTFRAFMGRGHGFCPVAAAGPMDDSASCEPTESDRWSGRRGEMSTCWGHGKKVGTPTMGGLLIIFHNGGIQRSLVPLEQPAGLAGSGHHAVHGGKSGSLTTG